jgi:hypothetical protein
MPTIPPWIETKPSEFTQAAAQGYQLGTSAYEAGTRAGTSAFEAGSRTGLAARETDLRQQELTRSAMQQAQQLALEKGRMQQQQQQFNVETQIRASQLAMEQQRMAIQQSNFDREHQFNVGSTLTEQELKRQQMQMQAQEFAYKAQKDSQFQNYYDQLKAEGKSDTDAAMMAGMRFGKLGGVASIQRAQEQQRSKTAYDKKLQETGDQEEASIQAALEVGDYSAAASLRRQKREDEKTKKKWGKPYESSGLVLVDDPMTGEPKVLGKSDQFGEFLSKKMGGDAGKSPTESKKKTKIATSQIIESKIRELSNNNPEAMTDDLVTEALASLAQEGYTLPEQ